MTGKPYSPPKQKGIPARFEPKFWETADRRCAAVREIKRRVEQLSDDAGVDSYQKQLLAQRAIFIAVQLETMEVTAMQGGEFSAAVYTQMANALSGILAKLNLNNQRLSSAPWLEPANKKQEAKA